MSSSTFSCDAQCVLALHQLVPGLTESPDEEKLARVEQHLQTLAYQDAQDAGENEVIHMSRQEMMETARARRREWRKQNAELAALRDDLRKKERQVQELSAAMPRPLDSDALESLVDACQIKKDLCVRNGSLDPATADALFALVARDADGKTNMLTLSRSGHSRGDRALAMSLFEVLKNNHPVSPGEIGVVLPYIPPGSNANQQQDENRLLKKLLTMANRT